MILFSSGSSVDISDAGGEAFVSGSCAAASGESATSDSDEVPGLSVAFLDGE